MKMWSVNVVILLLFCYACLSTGNGKVKFVSKNFNNVLHWDPEKSASPGEKVLYSVQYWRDIELKYQIKEECQNITTLTCDLTAETPSVPDVHYQAKVYANGHLLGKTTERFTPIAHTILGPPTLSTYTTPSSLHVNATLPKGPNGVSISDIISRSKNRPSTTEIVYTLEITEPKWAALNEHNITGRFVINLKNNKTKYCGHVIYRPSAHWGRAESEKASFCVTLPVPVDLQKLLPWLLIGVAVLAAIIIMSVAWMCNYVKGGKTNKIPQSLVPTTVGCKALQLTDSPIIFSTLVPSIHTNEIAYAIIQVKPKVPAVNCGGYCPQDIACQAWEGSTGSSGGSGAQSLGPDPQETSSQSYSAVTIQVATEVNDLQQDTTERGITNQPFHNREETQDKGRMSPEHTLHEIPPSRDVHACVQTVRDTNGQLILPLFGVQLPSTTDDSISHLNPERKPLLLDHISFKKDRSSLTLMQSFDGSEWSDSGCDDSTLNTPTQLDCSTHYSPQQPVISDVQYLNTASANNIPESGYKQNWMPASFVISASEDSCGYRKRNYIPNWPGLKQEEESEGDEYRVGEEKMKQSLLGNWAVQIQE